MFIRICDSCTVYRFILDHRKHRKFGHKLVVLMILIKRLKVSILNDEILNWDIESIVLHDEIN
ncbi:hypothetical protein Hanom_Chr06g00502781 [Helianthus anomalus]